MGSRYTSILTFLKMAIYRRNMLETTYLYMTFVLRAYVGICDRLLKVAVRGLYSGSDLQPLALHSFPTYYILLHQGCTNFP